MKVWLDGALVAAEDAVVPVDDHGFMVGDGLFETMKVVDGTAFAVRRHLARLRRTAQGLGLTLPYDDTTLRDAIDSTIDANHPGVGRVRLTASGGAAPLGSGRGHGPGTVVIQCGPLVPWDAAAEVITVPWPRNERGALAGLKTTSYAENVIAYYRAEASGAQEALFGNTVGNLCEGTGSNVFVVLDGRLITPPLSSGCLAGVTRELLLELALSFDLDAVEADVPMSKLSDIEEAFLTSSTRDVQAIRSIDDRALPSSPGPRTLAAIAAFEAMQAGSLDP
jgi:branched-chain amino acid aminotransferase